MNKRGSIIFALLLVTVFTALGAAILVRSMHERSAAQRGAYSTKAFWLAESGIQRTLWEMSYNDCKNLIQAAGGTACTSCGACTGTKTLAGTLTGAGDYDITVNSLNTQVVSVGSYPNRSSTSKIQRTVQATLKQTSPFKYAVFAKDKVLLGNNSYYDSYDSSIGNYGDTVNGVVNIKTNGNIGSNGTTANIVEIGDQITVKGKASTATGGTIKIGNGTSILGTTTLPEVPLPTVVVPNSLTSLANGGTYSVPNQQIRSLSSGDYRYTNLSMANNSTLNVYGAVNIYFTGATAITTGNGVSINLLEDPTTHVKGKLAIYVDGVLTMPNNVTIANPGNKAENLQIYSTYDSTKLGNVSTAVSVGNNGPMGVVVYAPNGGVMVNNNNTVYGSLIGRSVTVSNGSAVHYDESLTKLDTYAGPISVKTWTEN